MTGSMSRWIACALLVLCACTEPPADVPDAGVVRDGGAEPGAATLSLAALGGDAPVVIDEMLALVDGALLVDVVDVPAGALVSVDAATAGSMTAELSGWEATEEEASAIWWRTRPVDGTDLALAIDSADASEARVRITARLPPPDAQRDRSLVWTDPTLVDDPSAVGLAKVMTAAADGHGGALLDEWLRTFARTAHSERPALADFADHLRDLHGDDPASWDMDALPFRVTAVHNRLDLRNDTHCGELRVSLNVTDEAYPFIHFLFLFAQEPTELDVSLTGTLHCEDTAFRWSSLSALDDASFEAAARAMLEEAVDAPSFLMAESLERSVGTWEWRQWKPSGSSFENPPLFETVDVERLNAAGSERDDFLAWVEMEAEAIAARRALIPPRFAPLSARATEGVPRPVLDLSELDGALDVETTAHALDTVGCPGCHARSPTFLQTNADRTFSPFYEDELDARAAALDSFRTGAPVDAPFGALSD
jgi:hypothetical protein